MFNSTISIKKARFGIMDIGNFYLGKQMERHEYIFLNIKDIPAYIIEKHNLHTMVHNDKIYIEIRKGMYGLPQAGILANKLLQKNLKHMDINHANTPQVFET